MSLLNNSFVTNLWQSILRHFVGAAGTFLVADGLLNTDSHNYLSLQNFTGAAMFFGMLGWSVIQKKVLDNQKGK